jgi:hypothetical protein
VNVRERFLATMAFEPVDRPPLWEWGYWDETLRAWQRQGAPVEIAAPPDTGPVFTYPFSRYLFDDLPTRRGAHLDFALDPMLLRIPLNSFICPAFEYRVLEEHGDDILAQDPRGHIRRDKRGGASISNIVKTLVENRADWEKVKAERLALSMEGRLPANWLQIREELKRRDAPLAIGGHSAMCGFYHTTRYLLGPEHLLFSFYDQPDLIKDIMNHLADLYVFLFDRVLSEVKADMAFITEDIAYKAGPFISPAMFREFMLPCYRRLTGVLRDHGVNIIFVDTDGNNWPLVPLFIEGGMTAMGPMEVASDMDAVQVREAYPRLQIMGGIDKRPIAEGKDAIDRELKYRLGPVGRGGYIPLVDHSVSPDISWANFVYYRQRLAEMVSGG